VIHSDYLSFKSLIISTIVAQRTKVIRITETPIANDSLGYLCTISINFIIV